MLKQEWLAIFKDKIYLAAILVMFIMPLLYCGMLLWSNWDPYGQVEQLPVALVNNDKSADFEGEELHIGDELVKNLEENATFDFKLVSEKKAKQMLDDKDVYIIIKIPENFSENATTLLDDNPKKLELEYTIKQGTNFITSKIGDTAIDKIRTEVNEQVSKTYAEQLFKAIGKLSDGYGNAADGAIKIKDGVVELKDGTVELKDGAESLKNYLYELAKGTVILSESTSKLADGASSAKSGANELAKGADKLLQGSGALKDGAGKLQEGAAGLSSGVSQYTAGVDKVASGQQQLVEGQKTFQSKLEQFAGGTEQVDSGAQKLVDGTGQLATGAEKLADGTGQLATGAGQLADGNEQLAAGIAALGDNLSDVLAMLPPEKRQVLEDTLTKLEQSSNQIAQSSKQLAQSSNQIAQSTNQLAQSSNQLAQGASELAKGTTSLKENSKALSEGHSTIVSSSEQISIGLGELSSKSGSLVDGASQFARGTSSLTDNLGQFHNGVSSLSNGANSLNNGLGTLADGAKKLSDGTSTLSDKTSQLADGSKDLADGTSKLADGTSKLADGSDELATSLSDAKDESKVSASDKNYDMVASAVQVDKNILNSVDNYGSGLAPYFISLGLFVGALILTNVYNFVQPSIRPTGLWPWFVSKCSVPFVVWLFQFGILSVVLLYILKLHVTNVPLFLLLMAVTSFCFLAIIQLLVAVLDDVGRFISLIFLILQLASSAGTFPVQLIPKPLQAIHSLMPMTYSVDAFRDIISSTEYSMVYHNIGVLAVIGIVCVICTFLFFALLYKRRYSKPLAEAEA